MANPAMRADSRDCKFCGETFTAHKRNKIFCAPVCGGRYKSSHRIRDRKGEYWHSAPTFQCQGCGSDFKPKRTDRTKFCSRECAFETRAKAKKPAAIPRSKVYFPECITCGVRFTAYRRDSIYCSALCRPVPQYAPREKVTRSCLGCGRVVIGTAAKLKCLSCVRKESRASYRAKHGRVKKHRERAKRFGVSYEPINPMVVFDRDGWRCQVCGIRTPKRLRGSFDAAAPELDHRIPMSRGGSHTWDNVQTCCRSCNSRKGDSIVAGQMQMFAKP